MILFLLLIITFETFVAENIKLKKWYIIGPFLTGKTELDVDPLENLANHNCSREAILRRVTGCPRRFASEIALSGFVGWSQLSSTELIQNNKLWSTILVQFPLKNAIVDYNELVRGLSKLSVMEFQAWITTTISIAEDGLYEFNCDPIHSLFLDGALFAGDIYSQGLTNFKYLLKGKHYLDIRIRGKVNLQFKCFVKSHLESTGNPLYLSSPYRDSGPTDIIDGEVPFRPSSWMQLPLTNSGSESIYNLRVVIDSHPTANMPNVITSNTQSRNPIPSVLVPHHTQLLPFAFELSKPAKYDHKWWQSFTKSENPCLEFQVYFVGALRGLGTEIRSNSVTVSLRCRSSLQSFLFTFMDHDGSVVNAAAILPRAISGPPNKNLSIFSKSENYSPRRKFPILLSLSGVGVSTRSQADSHKYKNKPSDKDYTFGFEDMWILAPYRDGAHNWEGSGYQTAIAALDFLISSTAGTPAAADGSSVVVSGHSRGGHGALTVATHIPDRIKAIVSVSGYADRENYGDANTLFDMDLQLAYMDPLLLAIHLATIHEHDNLQLVDNLKGKNAFVRAGSADRTVNAFFQRQIFRVLTAEGVNATYSEKAGADHWYWDFDSPEDGGVVFDPAIRRFIQFNVHNNDNGRGKILCNGFEVASFNPSTIESSNGIRILQMISRIRKASVSVRFGADGVQLEPSNVRKFVILAVFWQLCDACSADRRLVRIGRRSVLEVEVHRDVFVCKGFGTSAWQECPEVRRSLSSLSERGPSNYGPARQVNHAPFVIVVGSGQGHALTEPGDEMSVWLLNAARYLSLGHLQASATVAPVLMDSDISASDLRSMLADGVNPVLLGGPHINSVSKMIVDLLNDQNISMPIKILNDSSFYLGDCRFNEEGADGLMFTFPIPFMSDCGRESRDSCPNNVLEDSNGRNNIGMMIAAASKDALYDAISFSFSSNVPLTRAPFSNMYGDYFVTSSTFRRKGLGGVRAVGFWGNDWEYQPLQGWTAGDCES